MNKRTPPDPVKVSFADFTAKPDGYLDRVALGEAFLITRADGRPEARLGPLTDRPADEDQVLCTLEDWLRLIADREHAKHERQLISGILELERDAGLSAREAHDRLREAYDEIDHEQLIASLTSSAEEEAIEWTPDHKNELLARLRQESAAGAAERRRTKPAESQEPHRTIYRVPFREAINRVRQEQGLTAIKDAPDPDPAKKTQP